MTKKNSDDAPIPMADSHLQAQASTRPQADQGQVLDTSVAESLRRLARRYVNNPESLVSALHLEPGPSGRFRIVITLEIAEIL